LVAGLGIVANALMRYFLGSGISGIVELSAQLLAVSIFLALPLAALNDVHVKVVVIADKFPRRVRKLVIALSSIGVGALAAVIGYFMFDLASSARAVGETTLSSRIPVAPFMLVAAIGSIMSAIAAFVLVFWQFRTGSDSGAQFQGDDNQ
jgi:TRAP-type C4-dicarboxylate transport system permease small subunit